jgi:conserved hypothetical protein TIGR00278
MRHLLVWLVRGYQLLLSPWMGGQCRFTPTCSQYTIDALRRHGAAQGSYLGMMRIVRCNPWCDGGHDPAPRVFIGPPGAEPKSLKWAWGPPRRRQKSCAPTQNRCWSRVLASHRKMLSHRLRSNTRLAATAPAFFFPSCLVFP